MNKQNNANYIFPNNSIPKQTKIKCISLLRQKIGKFNSNKNIILKTSEYIQRYLDKKNNGCPFKYKKDMLSVFSYLNHPKKFLDLTSAWDLNKVSPKDLKKNIVPQIISTILEIKMTKNKLHAGEDHFKILKKIEMDQNADIDENIMKCFKCKSTDIASNQRQTRSADEGMTLFCKCNNCGASWKG